MSSAKKKCGKCGKMKPLTEFYKNRKLKDGHRGNCKLCEKPMHQNCMLQCKFGITLADYDRMFEGQKGLCAICKDPERRIESGIVTRLCVDHDHKTGKVRGLLCRRCNSAIGLVNDDIVMLSRCIEYLTSTNTNHVGVTKC